MRVTIIVVLIIYSFIAVVIGKEFTRNEAGYYSFSRVGQAVAATFIKVFRRINPHVDKNVPIGKDFKKYYDLMLKEIKLPEKYKERTDKLVEILRPTLEKLSPDGLIAKCIGFVLRALELPDALPEVKKAILANMHFWE